MGLILDALPLPVSPEVVVRVNVSGFTSSNNIVIGVHTDSARGSVRFNPSEIRWGFSFLAPIDGGTYSNFYESEEDPVYAGPGALPDGTVLTLRWGINGAQCQVGDESPIQIDGTGPLVGTTAQVFLMAYYGAGAIIFLNSVDVEVNQMTRPAFWTTYRGSYEVP